MPLHAAVADPVCICAENAVYFHARSQPPPVRVFVGEYEFWQDAVGFMR